jgi:hypothetical protein
MTQLTFDQLSALLDSVFSLQENEQRLAILVDLPDARVGDHEAWVDRRRIAAEWFDLLQAGAHRLPFSSIAFCVYPNVGSNNNDLPDTLTVAETADEYARLPAGMAVPLAELLGSSTIVLALSEMSATAPLKNLAKRHGFRGATLPGFLRAMIPVLALDF